MPGWGGTPQGVCRVEPTWFTRTGTIERREKKKRFGVSGGRVWNFKRNAGERTNRKETEKAPSS